MKSKHKSRDINVKYTISWQIINSFGLCDAYAQNASHNYAILAGTDGLVLKYQGISDHSVEYDSCCYWVNYIAVIFILWYYTSMV